MQSIGRAMWLLGLVLMFGAGCCDHKSHAYNLNVSLDDSLKDERGVYRTVAVDFVGVNDSDAPRWVNKTVSEYWQPGDPFHGQSNVLHLSFPAGDSKPKSVPSTDPHWTQWLGPQGQARQLVVLCFIAGAEHQDMEGDKDSWRLILPLDHCKWQDDPKDLVFIVRLNGISCLTPLKSSQ